MKNFHVISFVFVGVLVLSGCQSKSSFKFDIQPRRVSIVTEPSGATITQLMPMGVPSNKLGVSPIQNRTVTVVGNVRANRISPQNAQDLLVHSGNLVVRVEKEGYTPQVYTLPTEPDELTTHNIKLEQVVSE